MIFKNIYNYYITFRTRKLCKLRKAKLDDIDFIIKLIIQGSQNGHYNNNYKLPHQYQIILNFYTEIIKGNIPITYDNDRGTHKYGEIWIYYREDIGNIGFVYLIENQEGSWEKEREIMLFSIKQKLQNKCFGNGLLNYLMSGCPNKMKVYARCYEPSFIMLEMLKRNNFKIIDEADSGTSTLLFQKGS